MQFSATFLGKACSFIPPFTRKKNFETLEIKEICNSPIVMKKFKKSLDSFSTYSNDYKFNV